LPGYVAAGETSQGGVNSVCKKKNLKRELRERRASGRTA
jgi:hypothetical protein